MLKGEKLLSSAHLLQKAAQCFRLHRPPWPVRLTVDFNPQMVL